MADFATLADVKAALSILSSDTSQDAALTAINQAATSAIIEWLNCDPRPTDYVERVNGMGTPDLIPRNRPITAVASVTILYDSCSSYPGDGSNSYLIDPSEYDFDDYLIFRKLRRCFPVGRRNITIAYTAGLDPVPKVFRLAALYTVRAMWSATDVDMNATGESWSGVNSTAWNAGGPGSVPVAAQTLLRSFREVIGAP